MNMKHGRKDPHHFRVIDPDHNPDLG